MFFEKGIKEMNGPDDRENKNLVRDCQGGYSQAYSNTFRKKDKEQPAKFANAKSVTCAIVLNKRNGFLQHKSAGAKQHLYLVEKVRCRETVMFVNGRLCTQAQVDLYECAISPKRITLPNQQ